MTKLNKKAKSSLEGNRQVIKTSDRYNRGPRDISPEKQLKTYLFTIDSLVLNCLHGTGVNMLRNFDMDDPQDVYEFGEVSIVKDKKTGNGTKIFKYGYDVSCHGKSVGLLLMCPRQSFMNEFTCSFKIHNHILYQKHWTVLIDFVIDSLGIYINNYTKLDIACDGHGFVTQYKKLLYNEYKNIGRSCHRPAEIKNGIVKGFYIGKRTSDKCMSGYMKAKEINISNKTYIRDWWKGNDLGDLDTVERLELRLKNKAVKSIEDGLGEKIDFNKLEDPEYLAGIFKSQTDGYYEFVKRSDLEKDSNIARAKKIKIIDWDQLKIMQMKKVNRIKKPCSIWAMKQHLKGGLLLLRSGYYPSKTLFDNEQFKKYEALALEYELSDWFKSLNDRIDKTDKSLIDEMRFNRMEIEAGNNSIYFDYSH